MIFSFIYGFFIFLIGTSWIFNSLYDYGGENYFLSITMTLLFISLIGSFFILMGYFINNSVFKYHNAVIPIYVASIWTIIEILRSNIFGGFPWLLIGTSQINFIYNSIFSIFGTYFISFISVMLSMIFFLILIDKERAYYIKYLFITLSLIAFLNISFFHEAENKDKIMKVTIIQPNIKPSYKYDKKNINDIKKILYDMSTTVENSDLIVYPETVVPELYRHGNSTYHQIVSKKHNILISGVFRYESDSNKIFNSMLIIDKDEIVYDKIKLVPFGEFTPFPELFLPFARSLNIPMSNLTKGRIDQSEVILDEFVIHPLICYESAYPNLIKQENSSKPGVIVILSNDSWFGDSLAPYQHLQISQTRAVEFNKYILRAANTGISAVIDNHGNIKGKIELNQRGQLTESFSVKNIKTIYSRFGDYPVLVLIFAIMISALYLRKKNVRRL